jgi:hypothetical protein
MAGPYIVDELTLADKTTGSIDIAKRVNEKILTPRINFAIVTYTMLGTEAAGEIIKLMLGMQGMTILPLQSYITSDGIAATATIDVGDTDPTADADRYCDGADVAAANTRPLFSATGTPVAAIVPYTLAQNAWIQATFATLATPVAGKKLRFVIAYAGA